MTLHRSRPQGFNGPAAIPISEIHAYARLVYLPDPDEAVYLIQQLDQTFLDYAQKKQKSQESRNGRARSRDKSRRRPRRR